MNCPNGHENPAGAKFCSTCGAQIPQQSVCPNGHVNLPGARFCNQCGAAMTTFETIQPQPEAATPKMPQPMAVAPQTPTNAKPQKKNKLLYILLAIISICLLYTFISLFAYHENGACVNEYHGYTSAKVKDPIGIYSQVYFGSIGMSRDLVEVSARRKYQEHVAIFLVVFILAEGGLVFALLQNKKRTLIE